MPRLIGPLRLVPLLQAAAMQKARRDKFPENLQPAKPSHPKPTTGEIAWRDGAPSSCCCTQSTPHKHHPPRAFAFLFLFLSLARWRHFFFFFLRRTKVCVFASLVCGENVLIFHLRRLSLVCVCVGAMDLGDESILKDSNSSHGTQSHLPPLWREKPTTLYSASTFLPTNKNETVRSFVRCATSLVAGSVFAAPVRCAQTSYELTTYPTAHLAVQPTLSDYSANFHHSMPT